MATTSGGAATTMFPSLERPTSDGEVPNPDLRPEQTARWLKQQDKTKEKKRRKSNKIKHRMTIHGHTGSGSTAANASNDRIRFRTESKKSKNGVRIYSTVKAGSFRREKSSSRFDVATTRERERTEQDARIEAAEAMSALATGIFSSETNRSSTSSRPASNEDSSDDGGNPLVIDCSVGDSRPQIVQQLPVGQQEDKDSSSSKKVHWGSKKSPHLQSILEQETLKEKSDVNASKNNDISGAALRTHSPVVLFGFANVNTLDPKLAGLYQHRGVVLPVRPELHGNKSVNTVSASAVCQPASNLKHMYLPVVAPALRSDLPRGGMLSTPMPDYQPPTKISRTVETQTSGSSASQEKQTVISPIPDLHTLSLGTNDANTPQTAKIEMGNEMLTDVVEILPRDSILLNKPRCRAEKADSHTGMLHNNLASSHNTTAEDSLVTNMPQPYVIQHLPSVSNTSNNLSVGKGRMLRQGHQSWPSVTSIHSSDSGKTTGNSSQPSDTTEPMDIDQSLRLAQKQALQRLNDNLTRAAPSERAFMLGQILAIVTMQKRNRLNPRQHSPTDNAARSVSPAQTMEISSSPISPVGQPAGQSTRHVPPALGTAQSAASPPEIRVQETSPKRKNPAKELIKLKPGEPKWPDSGLHPSIDSSSLPLVKSEKIRPENRPLSRNALPFSETAFYSNSSPILPLNPSFRQKAFSRPTPPSPTPKLIYSATNLSPHESGNESTTSHNNQSMSRSPSHSPSPRLAEQIATADSNNGSHLPFKKRRMANYSENTESLDACNVAKTRSPQTSEAIPPTISSVVTPVDSPPTAPQERSSDPLFAQARSAAASGGPPEVSRGRSSAPHLPVRSSDTLQVTATDLTLPKTINPITASPVNSVRTGTLPDIVPRVEDIKIALLPDEDGDVPLHIAVAHGNVAAAKHYVELMRLGNRSVDVVNKDRQIPLHIAVITNHLAVLRLLLKAGANVNFPNNIGQSSVHLAARRGHCNCLGTLVEMSRQEVQLNKKDFEGYSPLHLAVQKGHADAVSALIHHKADTNVQDGKSGRTPLFHASETNQVGIVDILLKAGAKVNTMNYAGSTAVMAASSRGYKDVVTLLTQYGADTKGTNIADLTAKGPPVRNSTNAALRHTVISPFPNSDDGKRVREKNKNTSQ